MAARKPHGTTIRLFLVDGTAQGMRVVDRVGWTGSLLAFNRAEYAAARDRRECQRTGAYILLGPDPDGTRTQRAYIGESEVVRPRLDSHQKEKDFWTHGFVLTTKDDSLNKAHVRYLEARLLETAREADNAVLENGTAPVPVSLSEHEIADMETYLQEVLTMLPLVGVNLFDVVAARPELPPIANDESPAKQHSPFPELVLATQQTQARGREDPRGFLVHAGALGRRQEKVMVAGYRRLRQRLLDEGALVIEDDDQIRLTKEWVFESPSAAASVLSGGNKNGRTEWRDAQGRTLKALQQRSAE